MYIFFHKLNNWLNYRLILTNQMAIFMSAVVEIMQSLIVSCNAVTLGDYFYRSMHYPVAHSSTMVTNLLGTASMLSIIWAFISDSYITRFTTFVISGGLQLMVCSFSL